LKLLYYFEITVVRY